MAADIHTRILLLIIRRISNKFIGNSKYNYQTWQLFEIGNFLTFETTEITYPYYSALGMELYVNSRNTVSNTH